MLIFSFPILILAFLLGNQFIQTSATLPSQTNILILTSITTITCLLARWRMKFLYLIVALLLGYLYTAIYAHSILNWTLAKDSESKAQIISGYIKSIPTTNDFGTEFLFALEKKNILVRLFWSEPTQALRVGDHWRLSVRMKRIHSTESPGAFDFEAWAIQNKIRASGSVIPGMNNIFIEHKWYRYPIDQIRQAMLERILLFLPNSNTSHWLPALIVGERTGIPQDQWQVLRSTGTNHLMAIAGLHIGIIAGLIHALVNFIWRRIPRFALRLPAQEAAAVASLFTAFVYSCLAGFSIPTQRACLMLSIFIAITLCRRSVNPWYSWALALAIVLITNPLVTLSESFWLSFLTIALIIYGMQGRLAPKGLWWRYGRVQWVISVGLIPLSLLLYQQASLVSFIANSIAIPWLAIFILPFCFMSSIFAFISPTITKFLLLCADKSLALLWAILTWLSQQHVAIWQQAFPSQYYFLAATCAFILFLLPKGMPGKLFGIIFLLPAILYTPVKPLIGEAWVAILDVGQGLSVVVQTRLHTLIYDVGPKLNAQIDAGENTVMPFLRLRAIKTIDELVVSHGDNDHIGGAATVIKNIPVKKIQTSVPSKFTVPAELCLAGQTWQWDQVNFTFLYPTATDLNANNDSSCVLKISNGKQTIILPGDIEKYAESRLLEQSEVLAAHYLIAPHHGSKTSAPKKFVAATHPTFVFYATGYKNRYHFPHKSVVANYTEIAAQQLNTALLGTIEIKLQQSLALSAPQNYRHWHARYWYD